MLVSKLRCRVIHTTKLFSHTPNWMCCSGCGNVMLVYDKYISAYGFFNTYHTMSVRCSFNYHTVRSAFFVNGVKAVVLTENGVHLIHTSGRVNKIREAANLVRMANCGRRVVGYGHGLIMEFNFTYDDCLEIRKTCRMPACLALSVQVSDHTDSFVLSNDGKLFLWDRLDAELVKPLVTSELELPIGSIVAIATANRSVVAVDANGTAVSFHRDATRWQASAPMPVNVLSRGIFGHTSIQTLQKGPYGLGKAVDYCLIGEDRLRPNTLLNVGVDTFMALSVNGRAFFFNLLGECEWVHAHEDDVFVAAAMSLNGRFLSFCTQGGSIYLLEGKDGFGFVLAKG